MRRAWCEAWCVCDALRLRAGKASFMGVTRLLRYVLSRPGVGYLRFPPHIMCACTGWWVALRVMTLNVVTGEV